MTLDLPLIIDELRSLTPHFRDDLGVILRRNIDRLQSAKDAADAAAPEATEEEPPRETPARRAAKAVSKSE